MNKQSLRAKEFSEKWKGIGQEKYYNVEFDLYFRGRITIYININNGIEKEKCL